MRLLPKAEKTSTPPTPRNIANAQCEYESLHTPCKACQRAKRGDPCVKIKEPKQTAALAPLPKIMLFVVPPATVERVVEDDDVEETIGTQAEKEVGSTIAMHTTSATHARQKYVFSAVIHVLPMSSN